MLWLGKFMLPANLVIFSTIYLMYSIKHDKSQLLKEAILEQEPASGDIVYKILSTNGIWSIERLLATIRAEYPVELTRSKLSRDLITNIKDAIKMK